MTYYDVPDDVRAVTVSPDQMLLLVPRRQMTRAEVQHLSRQLPDALRGRVLIVHDVDAFVVAGQTAEPGR